MFILLKLPHTSWHKIQGLKLHFLSETSSVIVLILLLSVSGLIWIILLTAWGQFWRCDQRLDTSLEGAAALLAPYPKIAAVIPARNEAEVIATSVNSLLNQDYPGELCLWVVDDQSEDGTATIVQDLARTVDLPGDLAGQQSGKGGGKRAGKRSLQVLPGQPLPTGWTGKLWALEQGTQRAIHPQEPDSVPDYLWLTDADIAHAPHSLSQLVQKAVQKPKDDPPADPQTDPQPIALVSLMVQLRCQSVWEKLLIPAFIFFFQKLYPFPWVNNPQKAVSAAAGGCILIQRSALARIGGVAALREALIDDCTLATQVKCGAGKPYTPIWLGLSQDTLSLRAYDRLDSIWAMVARTAYTQLNYSPLLLVGTIFGMGLVYLMAPIGVFYGLLHGWTQGQWSIAALGFFIWGLMTIAYYPTVKLYKLSILWAMSLPLVAFLYTLMTIDSARQHWLGKGGAWKGRTYGHPKHP
ncbi:MAG: glycosyltransferase [Prochlorotrichaceae cyanobacterium]